MDHVRAGVLGREFPLEDVTRNDVPVALFRRDHRGVEVDRVRHRRLVDHPDLDLVALDRTDRRSRHRAVECPRCVLRALLDLDDPVLDEDLDLLVARLDRLEIGVVALEWRLLDVGGGCRVARRLCCRIRADHAAAGDRRARVLVFLCAEIAEGAGRAKPETQARGAAQHRAAAGALGKQKVRGDSDGRHVALLSNDGWPAVRLHHHVHDEGYGSP